MRHLTRTELAELASRYHVENSAIEDVTFDDGAADLIITDPPYSARTQNNIRRGKQSKTDISAPTKLDFNPLDDERLMRWARTIATAAGKAALVFSDQEGSKGWELALEAFGMKYQRTALWVRTGDEELTADEVTHSGAPQFTGLCPAVGHECIVIAYRPGAGYRWNGGGKAAVYTAPVVPSSQRTHPTQKPLTLMQDIVRDFAKPGYTIADLFCGSGTTLVAAKLAGLGAFGVEFAGKHAAYAARRAAAASPT